MNIYKLKELEEWHKALCIKIIEPLLNEGSLIGRKPITPIGLNIIIKDIERIQGTIHHNNEGIDKMFLSWFCWTFLKQEKGNTYFIQNLVPPILKKELLDFLIKHKAYSNLWQQIKDKTIQQDIDKLGTLLDGVCQSALNLKQLLVKMQDFDKKTYSYKRSLRKKWYQRNYKNYNEVLDY